VFQSEKDWSFLQKSDLKSLKFMSMNTGNKTKSVDPAMGVWSYVYNGFGELTQQTDSKGQITRIEYDKLSRIVKK
jgi:YD repeat-containing protein